MAVLRDNGTRSDIKMIPRVVSLPYYQDGYWWYISRWSGSLLRSAHPPPFAGGGFSEKLRSALEICDNPFNCSWSSVHQQITLDLNDNKLLEKINRRLFRLGNHRFLLSIIYSCCGVEIFSNTKTAFSAISQLQGHKDSPQDRCFQRSLLAAKSSISFISSGILFIGAEFSTGEMHAWIIEDGEQPDPDDRTWINYRPLLALNA